jgi:hypothetical protein
MAVLEPFTEAMSAAMAPSAPEEIARLLAACVECACADLDLWEAEGYVCGNIVTMFPTPVSAWEAVVVGSLAYRLYPGFPRDDGQTIVWANIWVADNYDLAKFTTVLEEELMKAAVA